MSRNSSERIRKGSGKAVERLWKAVEWAPVLEVALLVQSLVDVAPSLLAALSECGVHLKRGPLAVSDGDTTKKGIDNEEGRSRRSASNNARPSVGK